MGDAIRCSNIIKQINDHSCGGLVLTSKIGLEKGVVSGLNGFSRMWAWCKGASYDKNEVAKSINEVFQNVNVSHLNVSQAELDAFCMNMNKLGITFNKGNAFNQSIIPTINKVSTYVLRETPTRRQVTPTALKFPSPRRTTGQVAAQEESSENMTGLETTPLRSRRTQSSGKTISPLGASMGKTSRAFLAFYRNEEKGKNGFMMDHILTNFSEADLEKHHNFIQWIFPTHRPSDFCDNAPVLNSEIVKAFKTDGNLRLKQRQALVLMLDHYGLQIDPRTDKISINPSKFAAKKKNFFINGSHNLRRISRILSSLTSLGQPKLAIEFYNCLEMLSKGPIPRLKGSVNNYWKPVVRSYLSAPHMGKTHIFPKAHSLPIPVPDKNFQKMDFQSLANSCPAPVRARYISPGTPELTFYRHPINLKEAQAMPHAAKTAFLGNFHPCSVEVMCPDNVRRRFRNSEAAFQAGKFGSNPKLMDQLMKVDGDAAARIGRDRKNQKYISPDWKSKGLNIQWMKEVLKAKFGQNFHLQKALCQTENIQLTERTPVRGRDVFYATDPDGSGENRLGQCLMELRQELKRKR